MSVSYNFRDSYSEKPSENREFCGFSQQRKREGGLRTRKKVKHSLQNCPLISVITVVYNGEQYLEQTIQSVFEQSYSNIEYIIIDGGSTDNTIKIIEKYADAVDYWISEPDSGIYDAMNKGIQLANGDLIVLLNADDFFPKESLMQVVERFNSDFVPEAIYYGDAYILYDDLQTKALRKAHLNFKKCMGIIHQTMFVMKSVYLKYGMYDLKYQNTADYDFSLRTFLNQTPYIYVEKPLVYSRRRPGRISEKFAKQSIAEEYVILRSHYGIWGWIYFMKNYFFSKCREIIHKMISKFFGERLWLWLKRKIIIRIRP